MWKVIDNVSSVESDATREDLARQLHEIERGEAAPWLVAPATGWWWPAAFGVWTATYTLTTGLLDGLPQSLLLLVHVLVMLAVVRRMRQVRGTDARGRSPRELVAPFVVLVVGALVVAAVVWGVCLQVGVVPGAVVGLVLAWALVAAYERLHARAVVRVRERLG